MLITLLSNFGNVPVACYRCCQGLYFLPIFHCWVLQRQWAESSAIAQQQDWGSRQSPAEPLQLIPTSGQISLCFPVSHARRFHRFSSDGSASSGSHPMSPWSNSGWLLSSGMLLPCSDASPCAWPYNHSNTATRKIHLPPQPRAPWAQDEVGAENTLGGHTASPTGYTINASFLAAKFRRNELLCLCIIP